MAGWLTFCLEALQNHNPFGVRKDFGCSIQPVKLEEKSKGRDIVAYVAFLLQNTPALKSFQKFGFKVYEIAPWSPPYWLVGIVGKWLPVKIAIFLGTRTFTPKLIGVKRIYLPHWQLLVSLVRRLGFSQKMEEDLTKFSQRKAHKFILRSTSEEAVLVLPSDYLNVLKSKNYGRVILEVRWHHTFINSSRPEPYLDFPHIARNGETKWEKNFCRLFERLDGVIVYSDLAANSFFQAGYPRDKFHSVPLLMPSPSVLPALVRTAVGVDKFLYVGRSAFDKGLDIAVASVDRTGGRLTVIGHFDENVISWLGKFPFVDFIGAKNRFDIYQIMLQHNIYLTTGIESFGFAVLEALRCGMKIVGSEFVGALNWYGNHPQVFLAQSLNVEHVVSAIHSAQKSPPSSITDSVAEIDPSPFWEGAIREILR